MTCPTCRTERDRWYDTTPQGLFPGLGYVTQASAAHDLTARGAADRRQARWEKWRDAVRFQRDLIARICAAEGHRGESQTQTVPRVIQLELDILGVAA
jgi:hypothetical protein